MPTTTRLADARRAVRAILANPALRRLEAAFLAFNVAEYGTWIAILVYANDATGSASVGIVAVAQLLPSAVFAPFAASLGDRYPRTRVLLGGYLAMGLAVLATGIAMAADASPLVVYPLAIVAASLMTVPRPLQAAVTPSFAETPEQLTAANGLNSIFEGLGVLTGPLAAAFLMAVSGPALVFVGGGVLCLGSVLLVRELPLGVGGAAASSLEPRRDSPAAAQGPPMLSAGFRSVVGDRSQALVVALLGSRFAVVGALDVLIVLLAAEALGPTGATAGFLAGAVGLGGVLGAIVTLVVVGRRGLPGWIILGSALCGAGLLLVATGAHVAIVALLLAAVGLGLACLDVAGRTLLQRITRGDVLAGVFGVVEASAMLGLAVGSLAAAVLYEAVGLAGATIATAAVLPAVAVAAWLPLRRADATLHVPVAQIAALGRLPLFSLVAPPSLEAAAAALVPFTVPARAIVFREGEAGDRFYVIASGSVEVVQGGRAVRRLGPGAGFGEIALLRDVPRTATVVAVADTDLWALDREPFLRAITGSEQAVEEAARHTTLTLARDAARSGPR